MGTVDIEQTVEEVLQSENILWDGKTPSFEKVEGIVRDVVTKVTERHYSMNDGEIDDWQVWEHDIVSEVNNRLERLSIDE